MRNMKPPVLTINGYDVERDSTMQYTGDDIMDIVILQTNIVNYLSNNVQPEAAGNADFYTIIGNMKHIPTDIYLKVLNAAVSGEVYPINILANSISSTLKFCRFHHSALKLTEFISSQTRTAANTRKADNQN